MNKIAFSFSDMILDNSESGISFSNPWDNMKFLLSEEEYEVCKGLAFNANHIKKPSDEQLAFASEVHPPINFYFWLFLWKNIKIMKSFEVE